MATEFVPSGVIEKASLHDMIYAACPRCFTSMNSHLTTGGGAGTESLRVQCSSCSAFCRLDELQFKYRLKIQVVYGSTVADAMLFDEVAESLLGVPASRLKSEMLPKHPSLPQVLEELLVGLRVSFSFQRPAPKRTAKQVQFTRDLKIVKLAPLLPQLLPEPAAIFAVNLLQQRSSGDHFAT
ncbi:Replication factor A, C-terminal [Phytophthora cinnamomi]|uniref:Replication factor A, C-terminal n=1 Tax=Phytophthora cinnamomi TaxID=4785 RepID=UPI00355A3BAA|nr:Replication factor A, C-terminal [Phytophthora cinnamomi]